MAELPFKQMISALVRQTRPQSFRSGKPLRYPQRSHSTVTPLRSEALEEDRRQWQPHSIDPSTHRQTNGGRLRQLQTDPEPRPFSSFLTDNYARQHNYLRISVTERCNLRCLYCMPEEGIQLSPPEHLLTTPEIVELSSIFVDQGVNKIRLTGGEPTVRKDIVDLMQQIGRLRSNGLKELCITSNGISLHRKLDSMIDAGLTGVNLSLDTLDSYQFTLMTRRNGHEAVMKSIRRILEMKKLGAKIKLKINCVVMRGMNEREIVPFVELGRDQDIEVRFIEYMPFDGNKWSEKKMMSFQEMLALIRQKYPDVYKVQDHANDTSKTYQVPGFIGRIGFITSMTHNFCGTCNRLRITSDGNLKVCLFGNSEVSLRDILRQSNDGKPIDFETMETIKQLEMDRREYLRGNGGQSELSERESHLLEVIGIAVKGEKEKHAGLGELENMKNRPMILIDDHLSFPSPPKVSKPISQPPASGLSKAFTHRPFPAIPVHCLPAISLPNQSNIVRFMSCSSQSNSVSRLGMQSKLARRFASTIPIRKNPGISVFRPIPCEDPDTVPARTVKSWHVYKANSPQSIENKTPRPRYKNPTATNNFRSPKTAAATSGLSSSLPNSDSDSVEQDSEIHSHSGLGPDDQNAIKPIHKFSLPFRYTRPAMEKGDGKGVKTTYLESSFNTLEPQFSKASRTEVRRTRRSAPKLSHLNSDGDAHMVSIGAKAITSRSATATATIIFSNPETYNALYKSRNRKGDAIAVSRIAGIQAAKKTADLIPLAHPSLQITGVTVEVNPFRGSDYDESSATDFFQSANENDDEATSLTNNTPQPSLTANGGVQFVATVNCEGRTGVEMEALSSATIAALAMYDMLKAVDKGITMTEAKVLAKQGGKSGNWTWDYQRKQLVQENLGQEGIDTQLETALAEQHRQAHEKKIVNKIAYKQKLVNEIQSLWEEKQMIRQAQEDEEEATAIAAIQEKDDGIEEEAGEEITDLDAEPLFDNDHAIETIEQGEPTIITSSIIAEKDQDQTEYHNDFEIERFGRVELKDLTASTKNGSDSLHIKRLDRVDSEGLDSPENIDTSRIGRVEQDDFAAVRMDRWTEWERR